MDQFGLWTSAVSERGDGSKMEDFPVYNILPVDNDVYHAGMSFPEVRIACLLLNTPHVSV